MKYLYRYGENSCQHSFVSMFCMAEKYGDMYAEDNGYLFILRSSKCTSEHRIYLFPMGDMENKKALMDAISKILEDAKNAQDLGADIVSTTLSGYTKETQNNSENLHAKWPACGEIDMMEYVGRFPNHILFSLHCKNHNHADKSTKPLTTAVQFDFKPADDFHVYGMEWTEDYIEYFVDGVSYCKYNKADDPDQSLDSWPFCKPFYLIVNLAIGGGLGGPVDKTSLPYTFTLDYIRVYQKTK